MENHKRQPKVDLKEIWVIGAGKFGNLAVSRIFRHFPSARIIVVDPLPSDIPVAGVTRIVADGVAWLDQMLTETASVDLIVPAVPLHLVARWIACRLGEACETHPMPVENEWLAGMPHPMPGLPGQVFVSHADFFCPDNCPEPADHCTMTGKPRPMDLFELLPQLAPCGIRPVVVRSRQLLAGVGGLLPKDLFDAVEAVRCHGDQPFMIATACRCHGVVDFIRFIRKPHIQGIS